MSSSSTSEELSLEDAKNHVANYFNASGSVKSHQSRQPASMTTVAIPNAECAARSVRQRSTALLSCVRQAEQDAKRQQQQTHDEMWSMHTSHDGSSMQQHQNSVSSTLVNYGSLARAARGAPTMLPQHLEKAAAAAATASATSSRAASPNPVMVPKSGVLLDTAAASSAPGSFRRRGSNSSSFLSSSLFLTTPMSAVNTTLSPTPLLASVPPSGALKQIAGRNAAAALFHALSIAAAFDIDLSDTSDQQLLRQKQQQQHDQNQQKDHQHFLFESGNSGNLNALMQASGTSLADTMAGSTTATPPSATTTGGRPTVSSSFGGFLCVPHSSVSEGNSAATSRTTYPTFLAAPADAQQQMNASSSNSINRIGSFARLQRKSSAHSYASSSDQTSSGQSKNSNSTAAPLSGTSMNPSLVNSSSSRSSQALKEKFLQQQLLRQQAKNRVLSHAAFLRSLGVVRPEHVQAQLRQQLSLAVANPQHQQQQQQRASSFASLRRSSSLAQAVLQQRRHTLPPTAPLDSGGAVTAEGSTTASPTQETAEDSNCMTRIFDLGKRSSAPTAAAASSTVNVGFLSTLGHNSNNNNNAGSSSAASSSTMPPTFSAFTPGFLSSLGNVSSSTSGPSRDPSGGGGVQLLVGVAGGAESFSSSPPAAAAAAARRVSQHSAGDDLLNNTTGTVHNSRPLFGITLSAVESQEDLHANSGDVGSSSVSTGQVTPSIMAMVQSVTSHVGPVDMSMGVSGNFGGSPFSGGGGGGGSVATAGSSGAYGGSSSGAYGGGSGDFYYSNLPNVPSAAGLSELGDAVESHYGGEGGNSANLSPTIYQQQNPSPMSGGSGVFHVAPPVAAKRRRSGSNLPQLHPADALQQQQQQQQRGNSGSRNTSTRGSSRQHSRQPSGLTPITADESPERPQIFVLPSALAAAAAAVHHPQPLPPPIHVVEAQQQQQQHPPVSSDDEQQQQHDQQRGNSNESTASSITAGNFTLPPAIASANSSPNQPQPQQSGTSLQSNGQVATSTRSFPEFEQAESYDTTS